MNIDMEYQTVDIFQLKLGTVIAVWDSDYDQHRSIRYYGHLEGFNYVHTYSGDKPKLLIRVNNDVHEVDPRVCSIRNEA
jgi:hypothetical protein